MSKRIFGNVVNLFISKDGDEPRESKEILTLELDGVCEDKFKGKDIERSVLLVSQKSYEMAKQNGINMGSGELGENILVDFDPYSFEAGTRLQIGDVVLEISKKSTLCNSLSKINNKLPKLLKDKRGMFSKVISGGQINKGNSITLYE